MYLDICPDSMLVSLLSDCDALPARFSNAKILDYVKKFNKNGTYLLFLNEMFSKHEAIALFCFESSCHFDGSASVILRSRTRE